MINQNDEKINEETFQLIVYPLKKLIQNLLETNLDLRKKEIEKYRK